MVAELTTPDAVFVQKDGPGAIAARRQEDQWLVDAVTVRTTLEKSALNVQVHCPQGAIARVVLRWRRTFPAGALFLGDAWERGYGDLQWRHLQPERIMPWYFAGHDSQSGQTFLAGVKTQPATLCFWCVDDAGISLWLDLRNGGMASLPGDRVIDAATVVSTISDQSPFAALKDFCRVLCPRPRLAALPVCGNNNWYYAYGANFDQHQVMRDAELLAGLADGHANRPYCVIDAGWSPGGGCPGGPWTAGLPDKFPDMPALAANITALGVRPGIWMRPTALTTVHDPKLLRSGPQLSPEKALDLTLPECLTLIHDDVARVRSWGYQLIKHDFSTWDAFGRWGFDFGAELTDTNWHWFDRALTNAEIFLRLYRTIRQAAGDALLIGCNTIGHLAAGLFEIQRTGDDTSGRIWERTRKMGVNTLAFRLPQHNAFFAADADCVAHTPDTPWDKDRQFLELVAASGSPLFVSVDPVSISRDVRAAMRQAMQLALSGGVAGTGDIEPLDWLQTTCPSQWRIGSQVRRFDWTESIGAWPLKC